jgi:hypothetical protein
MKTWPLAWMKGIIFCAMGVGLLWVLLAPAFRHRGKASDPSCSSNLKLQSLGLRMYAQDYDEHFPLADDWRDVVYPYVNNEYIFHCPAVEDRKVSTYAFNRSLATVNRERILKQEVTPMVFDATADLGETGGAELLPSPPRHQGETNVIGFVDGHVKAEGKAQISKLVWGPKFASAEAKKKTR